MIDFFQTVDILKRLVTEAEGIEYTEWYFRTEERISSLEIFVSILKTLYDNLNSFWELFCCTVFLIYNKANNYTGVD